MDRKKCVVSQSFVLLTIASLGPINTWWFLWLSFHGFRFLEIIHPPAERREAFTFPRWVSNIFWVFHGEKLVKMNPL